MKRIIIFDGLDCIGKTTVISNLELELKHNNFIPYIFHLAGPGDYCKKYFNEIEITNLNKSLIQWTKFIQLYETFSVILSANPRNIIILDRSPYSELIWEKFFNRISELNCKNNILMFCEYFNKLSDEIQFIHLDVNTKLIEERLYKKQEDLLNYNNYGMSIYNSMSTIEQTNVALAIETLKKEFYDLYKILTKYNIEVSFLENNTLSDIKNICNFVINKLII